MPRKTKYDVFLSYRRDGGEMLAKLLHDKLVAKGMRVFLDVESLRSGPFNTKLLDVITESTDFVIVLPPNALDRCKDSGDWVRLEIEQAIKLNKNVIPVMMRGFEWPESLPPSIASLSLYNGVSASHDYFDAAVEKLLSMLQSHSRKIVTRQCVLKYTGIAALTLLAIGAFFASGLIKNTPKYYTFEDSGIESLVRSALGKADGEITQAELDSITQLPGSEIWDGTVNMNDNMMIDTTNMTMLKNISIKKLTDLYHLPSIERLNLGMGIEVNDISPLGSLNKLTMLDISGGKWNAEDHGLETLSNLKSMTYLDLSECQITDISFLQSLVKLKTLDLSNNEITSILPLSKLKGLNELSLASNNITDLTPLAQLNGIVKLNLAHNNFQDLSAIFGMVGLTHLNLSATGLSSLDSLPLFPKLQYLVLGENNITSIAPLEKFQALQKIYLPYNYPLRDISPLLKLPLLRLLVFYQFQNFVPFEQITELINNGCEVLLEPEQKEAMQRYYAGTYLVPPSPKLKTDNHESESVSTRFTPHGVAFLSLLNGQTYAAIGNSLYLFDSDYTTKAGINVNNELITFTSIAEISIRHTTQEGVVLTYKSRNGKDNASTEIPSSYQSPTGTLCFITADGFAADVSIRNVMQIQFDWSQVPVVDANSYYHILGSNVDIEAPLASIRITAAYEELMPFWRKMSNGFPLTNNQNVSFADIKTADFEHTSSDGISVRYTTIYDPQVIVDKLSQSSGELHALSGEKIVTIPLVDIKSIKRVEETTATSP